MDKLKMHTSDIADENYRKLATLFPDAITETTDEEGNVVRAVDADVLMQEINRKVVKGDQQRYQFTWPDKRKALNLANTPTTKTLRPLKDKSIGRDGTLGVMDSENLYIEGDNLDALKIIREAYLKKIKVIYIDPPYNTGKDFIYGDDFTLKSEDYKENSAQLNAAGLRMVQNMESNGRFHTDWLNMIYPRLKIAKDLLTDDGIIFISINDKEHANLRKVCNEVFGADNCLGEITWESVTQPVNTGAAKCSLQKKTEPILVYARNINAYNGFKIEETQVSFTYPDQGKFGKCRFEIIEKSDEGTYNRDTMKYPILGHYPRNGKRWTIGKKTAEDLENKGRLEFVDGTIKKAVYPSDEIDKIPYKPFWSLLRASDIGSAMNGKSELNSLMESNLGFDTVKPVSLIKTLLFHMGNDYKVLDFFSGSATTAHAVLELNSEDKGSRSFIMVQIPEPINERYGAYKAGYETICQLGQNRIIRAGQEIKNKTGANIDYGFRCFKVDSSNMKNVYYIPSQYDQDLFESLADNIKADRSSFDLLIQVMLDLGIDLSSKIEKKSVANKEVYNVADGYLFACFDKDITDEVVKIIAKKRPFYAVFRDNSMATDSVAVNFDQIFNTYSPKTIRKVL